MDLNSYESNVRALLNDPLAQFYTSANIDNWINQARVETAKKTGCIRLLTPSSAPVDTISVTNGGSGYSTATVTVSAPDAIGGSFTTATATASLLAGQVTSITITNPGTGYVTVPTVTITGNGTGATATAALEPHLTTVLNQEVYTFASTATILQSIYGGVQGVIGVLDVAVSWGAMKPSLQWQPWSLFQAYARAINQGTNWPQVWSQYAVGETGSAYLYPIPSGTYEMQWDCFCTPQAMTSLQTVDLIPDNWTTPVFYYACYLAYLNAQRKDDANDMYQRWERACADSAQYSTPSRTPSFYPDEF